LLAVSFAPAILGQKNPDVVFQVIAFAVGGGIGALLASPLYYVSVFLTGAVMGALVGIVFGAYLEISTGALSFRTLAALSSMPFPPPVESTLQLVLMIIFGITAGGLTIAFQKFMLIASTAFIGSAMVIAGQNGATLQILRHDSGRAVWILLAWLILGLVGMFVQFRMQGET
jgi:hypothetical protein